MIIIFSHVAALSWAGDSTLQMLFAWTLPFILLLTDFSVYIFPPTSTNIVRFLKVKTCIFIWIAKWSSKNYVQKWALLDVNWNLRPENKNWEMYDQVCENGRSSTGSHPLSINSLRNRFRSLYIISYWRCSSTKVPIYYYTIREIEKKL